MARAGARTSVVSRSNPTRWLTRGLKVKHLIMGVAVAAACLGVVRPVLVALDAGYHGPHARWYNARCQRLATQAGLIGKAEGAVEQILGKPGSIWDHDQPGGRTRTYNYAPSPWASSARFQVHCQGGFVVRLEQLDD